MFRTTVFALLLAAAPAALATQDAQPKLAIAEGDFAAQRAEIETDLADGKTYAEISSADRGKVREYLERISSRLEGVDSIDSLNDAAKADLFNDQEVVNTILTQAESDSRVVCQRVAPTGSNRKVTTCETVAERRRRTELDQENLQRVQKGRMPLRN